MCGRFALALAYEEVEAGLHDLDMPSEEWIGRDSYRPRYNFAPQNLGPVVRRANQDEPGLVIETMKWGLVPHWTKRTPDYKSMLKTINARDDNVLSKGGMWASLKGRKRCVVPCQGFYEWLKKGNEKIPHFTKRPDGKLMCFAGLWDSVTYEGEQTPLYTFTVITTSSNKQLSFLHDRMPVILSTREELHTWLDTSSQQFTDDVAKLLRPYEGPLECYAVPKEVGKVGNQSPDFVQPVEERKGNIASFFGKAAEKTSPAQQAPKSPFTSQKSPKVKVNQHKETTSLKKEDHDIIEIDSEGEDAVEVKTGTTPHERKRTTTKVDREEKDENETPKKRKLRSN